MIPAGLMSAVLASTPSADPTWTPFLGPWHGLQPFWWLLVIPFAFLISVMWKAIRVPDMRTYWRHVLVMWTLILLGLVALGIALAILIDFGIPAMPVNRP